MIKYVVVIGIIILLVFLIVIIITNQTEPPIESETETISEEFSPTLSPHEPPPFKQGQVIVKFKDGFAPSIISGETLGELVKVDSSEVSILIEKYDVTSFKNLIPKAPEMQTSFSNSLRNYFIITFDETIDVSQVVDDFSLLSSVDYVEPDYFVEANVIPNDPLFGDLIGLHNIGQWNGVIDTDIDAPEAWDTSTGSSNIIIGIVDSGIDYLHPDLVDNMWINPGEIPNNGIDDEGNGYVDDIHGFDFINNDNDPMDDNGHGTHVAGIVGAVGNNGIGVSGVNWDVSLMALKVLDSNGAGTWSAAAEAVNYATMMNADLTNNSYGTWAASQTMFYAVDDANNAGILFVTGAGNWRQNSDEIPFYPGSYDQQNIVTVAAYTHHNYYWGNSNYGENSVDLAAIGYLVKSTVPTADCPRCDPSGYKLLSGTSQAAPYVAGALAFLKPLFPSEDYRQLKTRILESTEVIPPSQPHVTATNGLLNLHNAIDPNLIVPTYRDIDLEEMRFTDDVQVIVVTCSPDTTRIKITNTGFDPEEITIPPDTTICWMNLSDFVIGIASGTVEGGAEGAFDSSILNPNSSHEIIFEDTGVYHYFDLNHPWVEEGTITVE